MAGGRDPRVRILESDDPFTRSNHPPHVRTGGSHLPSFMMFQEFQPARMHTGRLWHFSEVELRHLALATGAFTLALGFMWGNGLQGLVQVGLPIWLTTVLIMMPLMAIAVAPAFVLHEIGHKIIARKNGCWAEFRADPAGLRFGVLLALLLGIVFMSPGAVMVAGNVDRRQNGHIAVAGPVVNLMLAAIGVIVGALLLGTIGEIWWVVQIIRSWVWANVILGLFNMLPFGPLDGVKVKEWSEPVFYTLICIFATPLLFGLMTGSGIYGLTLWLAEYI